MGQVVVEITMSLDGFVAGPDVSPQQPLGVNGERLHDWMFTNKTATDEQLEAEIFTTVGAVVVGGRTYRDGIDSGWGGVTPFHAPAFVVLSRVPDKQVDGFTYVTDGIASALRQAQAVVGDKDVWVMGGAHLIQQYLKAGLVDELHIHIAPILLQRGTRLFEQIGDTPITLEATRALHTPGAAHLRYHVIKAAL